MTEYKKKLKELVDLMVEKVVNEGYPINEAYAYVVSQYSLKNNLALNNLETGYIHFRGSLRASQILREKSKGIELDWVPNPNVQRINVRNKTADLTKYQMIEYVRQLSYDRKNRSQISMALVKKFNVDLADAQSQKFKLMVNALNQI